MRVDDAVCQPPISTAVLAACRDVMAGVDSNGNGPAVWVHAGAVAAHAAHVGLVPAGFTRQALDAVARLHPALEYWGRLSDSMPADVDAAVTALWARERVIDPGDPQQVWYTYPLGDLYQALSVEAVKGRALCQTPWWVTKLLLEISYDRAVEVWDAPRVIDPSCGTGNTLVESYMAARAARTIARRWPDDDACLDAVHGVDLDPHAAATAAYRLIVMASAKRRHKGGPVADLPVHVVAADSLLAEDEPLLQRGRYHVVVANPPYIVCRDKQTSDAIRARYPETAHRKYSLALPFHQLMMELLVPGGWCAQLTANSFMKREFGKKYIEGWLPQFHTEWIIDTSGAYIPGHGTPTVIMCHRNQTPTNDTVRTIQGMRGEPAAPADPARGLVWGEIARRVRERETFERAARRAAPVKVPASIPMQRMVQPTLFEAAA